LEQQKELRALPNRNYLPACRNVSVIAHLDYRICDALPPDLPTRFAHRRISLRLDTGITAIDRPIMEGAMPNRIGSMLPMGFTALYAMLAVIDLPNGSARAADDCLAAPNSQPPQGSHWYYRIDGAKQRHCWYLGPEGQKVHRAEPEVQPAVKSAAPLRTDGGRPMASAQVEPPLPPLRPGIAAGATVQASVQGIAQEARGGTPAIVQWPDPQQPASAGDREAGGPSTLQDVDAKDEVVRPAAASAAIARTMLMRVILLVVSALAVAGIFQHAIFRMVVARRRIHVVRGRAEQHVARGRAEQSVGRARERTPPAIAPPRASELKRAPVQQIDPQDIEEGFRQILRTVERHAA
jgi:hypothetical protein